MVLADSPLACIRWAGSHLRFSWHRVFAVPIVLHR